MKTLDHTVSEKAFQANVVKLATWTGWRSYHTHDSRRSNPGFPDLVLVRDGRLLFVELKSERGTLNPAQRVWLAELRRCPGVEAYVWRPSAWSEIEATLR